MKQQTAVEWLFEQVWVTPISELPKILKEAKEMEKQQIIYLLETYHNRMFIIPLNEGEAERIYNHIKKTNESNTKI